MGEEKDIQLLTDFGNHLKKLRNNKGFSQSDLSAIANVPISQISRIERGIGNPTLTTLNILANALGLDKKDMLDF